MFRRYLLGLSVLALAACSGGCDAFKPTRYIHAVEVELRAEKSTQESPGLLPMGTQCKVLEDEGLLDILVRCGKLTGYVNRHALGLTKPTVEGFLKVAVDPKVNPSDRLEQATRAVALAPAHAEARAVLKQAYLDDQFHLLQLRKEDEDAKPVARESVCEGSQTVGDCLTQALLPVQLFSARMVERRGTDFVGVGFQAGQLHVVGGTLRRSPSKSSNDIAYTVYSRGFGGVDVPRVADALGLKPAQEPERLLRYTTNDNSYYVTRLCDQLTVTEGAASTVLVDLPKQLPPGRRQGEIRDDLHLMVVLDLLLVSDFDQDGRDDALVEISAMGSCCEPCYFFATTPRKGKPVLTNGFCGWWGPPLVEWANGEAVFSLPGKNGGEKAYVLDKGRARRR